VALPAPIAAARALDLGRAEAQVPRLPRRLGPGCVAQTQPQVEGQGVRGVRAVPQRELPYLRPAWIGAGAEYALARGQAWSLLARAGYNTAALDTRRVNGLSAGFGLARKGIALDYAFRTMGLLGATHHFGLTYGLGK